MSASTAGLALNLKRYQVFLYDVLRPALKTIFPALSSQFILLMLTSSIVSTISADNLASVAANIQSQTFRSFEIYIVVTAIIGFTELTRTGQVINSATFAPLPIFSLVAFLYFCLCWPLSKWSRRLERKLSMALR